MEYEAQIQSYGSPLTNLVSVERLPELGPGAAVSEMRHTLRELSPKRLFGDRPIINQAPAQACLSGLWLWYDFLDESHDISQVISDANGSFWHGIMHRREPDYSNAKYWFNRVGSHPAYPTLHRAVQKLHQSAPTDVTDIMANSSEWDPMTFVDLCSQHYRTNSPEESSCREIAKSEWFALFDFCYQAAIGG